MTIKTTIAVLLAYAVLSSGACAPARGVAAKKTQNGSAAAAVAPTWDESDAVEASLRGKNYRAAPQLEGVRFDYDRDSLSPEALAILKRNAAWLKGNPETEVLIQGRCDERGTTAYNLALGQRRARAVRDYYDALGVPAKRMATISYGKEKPLCIETTEDCRSKNRAAETLLRMDDVAAKESP
jgi:peptidoglycan-associated lipoprotein